MMISSRIRRNLDNIEESTILAIYDDIMDLQILTRYVWVLSFCVWWRRYASKLITFWQWPAFEHFTDFADIEHFLLILQCCTRYRSHISPIDDDVTRYRSICWLFCFWWHSAFYDAISSYWGFLCVWRYLAFLDLSGFPPIYIDFVHFRPAFLIIRLMSFQPPPISPIWANSA